MHSRSPERASAMKFNIKKVSIFGLAAIFFASVMMCCCLTETVQAEEPASSCHQTFQETDSPQDKEECDCEQMVSILAQKDGPIVKLDVSSVSDLKNIILPYPIISKTLRNPSVTLNYQGPPKTAVTSLPVYIQNSNLRL